MKVNLPIQNISSSIQKGISSNENSTEGVSFGEFLNDAINKVSDMQLEAQKMNEALALGQTDNLHQVMIASEKASVALQFTMQVRNKILDAYQEIMRMPI